MIDPGEWSERRILSRGFPTAHTAGLQAAEKAAIFRRGKSKIGDSPIHSRFPSEVALLYDVIAQLVDGEGIVFFNDAPEPQIPLAQKGERFSNDGDGLLSDIAIESVQRKLTKGTGYIEYRTKIYWISFDDPVYKEIEQWDHEVSMANELRSSSKAPVGPIVQDNKIQQS